MRSAVDSGQWTAGSADAARLELMRRTRVCDVEGCDNLVMDGLRCVECEEQLRALEEHEAARRERRSARAEIWRKRFEAALRAWLWFWDWACAVDWVSWALGLAVVSAFGYMGFVFWAAFFGVE